MKKLLSFVAIFTLLLIGCTDDNSLTNLPSIAETTVGGYIQKGPFISGTIVDVKELDDSFNPTGKIFSTQIINDFGNFSVVCKSDQNYAEFVANGYYFDETTGDLTTSQLVLRAISKIDKQTNINILTTLQADRVKRLIQDGVSYEMAIDQSKKEVLSLFLLNSDNISNFNDMNITEIGSSNSILLAISSVLQQNRSVAEMSELISKISLDIADNGLIDSENIKEAIIKNAKYVNSEDVIRHLVNRYKDLGFNIEIDDFNDFIDSDGNGILNGDEPEPPVMTKETEQTIIIYAPSAQSLDYYIKKGIENFESALINKASEAGRVVCLLGSNLFEMRYFNGEYIRSDLKEYELGYCNTKESLSALICDIKEFAPADRYGLIYSGFSEGWLPKDNNTKALGSGNSKIDITEFAKGIEDSDTHMEFILFDAVCMSNIEVAYDLKDVTDYIIASPTEIMAIGFPYLEIGGHLLGDVDYENIVAGFYKFYHNSITPYGTIAVVDCGKVDDIVSIMKNINTKYTFNTDTISDVQVMDGHTPTILFDMGSYISQLCGDVELLKQANIALDSLVPYKSFTPYFFTSHKPGTIEIKTYSGITISDPSINKNSDSKIKTSWYKATH